jgi:hypothetical protein
MAYLNNDYPNLRGGICFDKIATYDPYYYMEKEANIGSLFSRIKGMIPGLAPATAKAAPTLTRRALNPGSAARFNLASRTGRLGSGNISMTATGSGGNLVPKNISGSVRAVGRSGKVTRVPSRMVQQDFTYRPRNLPSQPSMLPTVGQSARGAVNQLSNDANYAAQRAGQFYADNKAMVDVGANFLGGLVGPQNVVANVAGNVGGVMKAIGAAQRAILPAHRVNPAWSTFGTALSNASDQVYKTMGYL